MWQLFCLKITKLRELKGWSKEELGRRMGKKDGAHVRQIELGRRSNLSLKTACELAKVFDITLDELVKDTEFDLRKEREKYDRL